MTPINTRELTKIVRFMKKHGVLKLKDEGIVIELCQEALRQDKDEPLDEKTIAVFADPFVNAVSEEEVLYHSVGGSGAINSDGSPVELPLMGD